MKPYKSVSPINNYLYIKRLFDITISSLTFLTIIPLVLLIYLLNFLLYKENPIFIQERIGFNMRPFKIIKFKTMVDGPNVKLNWSHGNKQITKFGKFLRKYSLDEILSLINVIKGDMSIVGPRPLFLSHVRFYNQRGYSRHLVRPGVTGLAQIMGRNDISWKKRFDYDYAYTKLVSYQMDIFIIMRTVVVMMNKHGYNENGDEVIVEDVNQK
jgi:lipopolysaccharide/colanic/teichoic acid biosynthesis glycosyltransferase